MSTLYDELGGHDKLAAIIDVFVDRVCDDVMIGFFFRHTDRAQLKKFELQHAAKVLGATMPYEGRPLREAHAAHRIMGGQFARRKQILKEVLQEQAVPPHIQKVWLDALEKLRPLITGQPDAECD
jgi:hemoglobin